MNIDFEAHSFFESGFQEFIYQRAFAHEMYHRLEVGLLLNFGSKSLIFKRLVLSVKSNNP